jgi:hypothetical protein
MHRIWNLGLFAPPMPSNHSPSIIPTSFGAGNTSARFVDVGSPGAVAAWTRSAE